MKLYKNVNGESGILKYELGEDYIKVQFIDGEIYLYNYKIPGKKHVEEMKRLATEGKGLATYINVNIRENYAKKI